uniref:Uncharacterized protein n=1 Tax=Anguilla anguilla TaxID=7936 RepID=A0A0E9W7K8_ANGAN
MLSQSQSCVFATNHVWNNPCYNVSQDYAYFCNSVRSYFKPD